MGLAAGQHAWMVAASGLLRSDAGRSGYAAVGRIVPLYALSNVARSNATRSNYHGARAFISIDGLPWGLVPRLDAYDPGILDDSLQITDLLDAAPNRCTFVAWAFQPHEGQQIQITLGSINGARLFRGRILSTDQYSRGKPSNLFTSVNAIDDTWGLDTRLVSERYTSTSYETIVRELVAKYAGPAYTVAIEAGLGIIDEITFTNASLPSALTQLAKRGGYSWLCDEWDIVRFFATDTWNTPPAVINAAHPSLADFQMSRDLSQVVTRVCVEGGGVAAAATVDVGETLLPLNGDPGWYHPAGGTVATGPQRLRYGGVYGGGGGGLVGPGASPSGRPVVNLVAGAGMSDGARAYAVTYTTAAGESIPSPPATITCGPLAPPATAPLVVDPPTAGIGPEAGTHTYAVTYGTDSGETTAGPPLTVTTELTAAPGGYPVPQPATQFNGSVPQGAHDYALAFVTDTGETPAGPIGPSLILGMGDPPATAPTVGVPVAGPGPSAGTHYVAVTFGTGSGETIGETTIGPSTPFTIEPLPPPTMQPIFGVYNGSGLTVGVAYRYVLTYSCATDGNDQSQETTAGPVSAPILGVQASGSPAGTASGIQLTWPYVPLPAGVKWIKVYRSDNGGAFHRIGGSTVTINAWTDTAPLHAIIGFPGPPSFNGAATDRTTPYTMLPLGPAGTTRRKVYRTRTGSGIFLLVGTISNNSATAFTDTVDDGALGAEAPAVSTAPLSTILLEVPTGPTGQGITGRKLYRRSGGVGLRYLATIGNNSQTTYTDTAASSALGAAPPETNTARLCRFKLTAIPIGPSLVRARHIYRTRANDPQLYFLTTLPNNTATTYTDSATDSELGGGVPVTNTALANQVQITGIPIGAATVLSRKIYRTWSGGTTLLLLVVLPDNLTTSYLDALPDAALGTVAPSSDTSGLQQPQGSVSVGATQFQIASIGPFPPEGWAVIGNGQQVIRYRAVIGNSLTGIPAVGAGSITAAIAFNSTVTAAPQLTGIPASGIGAIRYPIRQGDDVNLFVQREDLAAQAQLAALLGTDGIIEYFLQDRRLSQTEAEARGDAQLALRSQVEVGVSYSSRDVNTRAGRIASVNLPSQHTVGDFKIQQVTIVQFGVPDLLPTFQAQASSSRFTFEDLLRAARKDGA